MKCVVTFQSLSLVLFSSFSFSDFCQRQAKNEQLISRMSKDTSNV